MTELEAHAAAFRKEVASISEGFCPRCSSRLIPVESAQDATGLCPEHGSWRVYSERERQEDQDTTWVEFVPIGWM